MSEALIDCRGEHSRSGSGSPGGYSGGGGGGRGKAGAILDFGKGVLGIFKDVKQRRQQQERNENNRLGGEANEEGREHLRRGRYEQALYAFQRAYQYFQRNGETGNMNVAEHNARLARDFIAGEKREEERKRWEEQHKAKQAERDQMVKDLFSPNLTSSGGRDNPFGSGKTPQGAVSPVASNPVAPPAESAAPPQRATNPFEPQSEASLRPARSPEKPPAQQMQNRPECLQSDDARWADRAIAGGFNTAEELILAQQDLDRRRKLGCFAAPSDPPAGASSSIPERRNPF